MTKKEVQQRVSQYNRPLALSKFRWNEGTNAFSSREWDLIINFQGIADCTFKVNYNCTFITGHGCTFETGSRCIFRTGSGCTFWTGGVSIFDTGDDCVFKSGPNCTFKTGACCTFAAVGDCTFSTGFDCTWVVSGKHYPFAPLLMQGGQWRVSMSRPGYLRIGCREHTFGEWGGDVGSIARKHTASPKTLKEYLELIKVAKAWAKEKGWLTPG